LNPVEIDPGRPLPDIPGDLVVTTRLMSAGEGLNLPPENIVDLDAHLRRFRQAVSDYSPGIERVPTVKSMSVESIPGLFGIYEHF